MNNKKILVDNEMFEIEFNEDNGLNVESDGWDDDEIDDSGDEVMWDIDDFRIFLRFIPNENPAKEKILSPFVFNAILSNV